MKRPVRWWRSRRVDVTVLLFMTWSSSACMHWKTQSIAPERIVGERRAAKVRVTKLDGTRLVLHQPEIIGETLVGVHPDAWPRDGRPRPAVALADVGEVALRRVDPIGTAAIGLGTLALAGVVVLGLLYSKAAD